MRNKIVEFRNESFRYGEEQPWVLKDCSFELYENEAIDSIGHNGSGRSRIVRLINGLLFSQQGEIVINERAVKNDSIWDIRKDVGMVFQNPDNQFVGTTVQDDVAFGMENRGVNRN